VPERKFWKPYEPDELKSPFAYEILGNIESEAILFVCKN
jgi:hypothetical protein